MDYRGAILATFGMLLVALPTGTARGADNEMEVGLQVGFLPERVHGSTASPITGASTPDGRPAGVIGDDSFNLMGASIGGNAAIMLPDFGPGIPRMFFYGDVAIFLGRKNDTRFNLYDTNAGAQDTDVTLKRNFAVDLAFGGLFPFCGQKTCLDLRVFVGANFLHQNITTAVDETSNAGKKEEFSEARLKPAAFFGTLLSIPFSDHLRLQLGFLFRGLPTVAVSGTSGTGRTYITSIDGGVETQLTAGLVIPFAL